MLLPLLADLFTSLTTPCSPSVRALGYLAETLDMRRRSRRNRAAWQPHLEATRRSVLASAERCGGSGRVVILGSGLLLDVPLPELSARFREVVLKDVLCLPETRKELKRFGNVRFQEHDVTGVAGPLACSAPRQNTGLPEPLRVRPDDEQEADLVVSLNILSQLWVVPRAYASRHVRDMGPEQVDEWCAAVTEAHYTSLRRLRTAVCLVADHRFVKRDRGGSVISSGSTIGGLTLPEPDQTWTWNIAPLSPASPDLSKELIVGAWHFAPGT